MKKKKLKSVASPAVRVSVSMPKDLYRRIQDEACLSGEETGSAVSEACIVRRALALYLVAGKARG